MKNWSQKSLKKRQNQQSTKKQKTRKETMKPLHQKMIKRFFEYLNEKE